MNNSIKANAALNAIKTLVNILFPLITFKYASEVLMADNLGKVNFSNSIISYFVLFADFGILTYAAREGAKYRDSRIDFESFSSEIMTINLISVMLSYAMLVILILTWGKLDSYKWILIVQSFIIVFTALGATWINTAYEDFKSLLYRSLFVQVVSLILLFVLVRKQDDYLEYALISVIAQSGGYLLNFFYLKKYRKFGFSFSASILRHLKPLLIIFCTSVAVTVYVNSDITMIGLFGTDKDVALYTVAVKIYTVIKAIFSAILLVEIPRLTSLYYNNDLHSFQKLALDTLKYLTVLIIPVIILSYLLSQDLILFISTGEYLDADLTFKVLCIAIAASLLATLLTNVLILPQGLEIGSLYATLVSAVLNVILNLFFIPTLGILGAAYTTVIAEICVCIILYLFIFKKDKNCLCLFYDRSFIKCTIEVAISMLPLIFIGHYLYNIINDYLARLFLIPLVCGVAYMTVMLLVRNEIAIEIVRNSINYIIRFKKD